MKKIAKGFGIGIIVAVIGLLIFGAVNRTIAMSEEETQSEYQAADFSTHENEVAETVDETDAISEHDTLSTPIALLPLGDLSQAEIDALFFMREEEKLARDVYLFLASQWGLPAFSNIAKSEQTHMDSVLELFNRYGLTDSASAEAGVFNNIDLQALYNQLIAQGSISAEEAFKVGAAIEEIDILDLQVRLTQTDQEDIQQVFNSLLLGSYNHLNAFVGNLSNRYGITYEPQYISSDLYQQILSTETGGNGSGFGKGQGGGGNGNK
ncbi:MAG: DUF2202 domain-containing protein [Anaerolineaceae bacterium]|nr:DUF2202 domain-containing protein [Anaerolineaceae bacterium]